MRFALLGLLIFTSYAYAACQVPKDVIEADIHFCPGTYHTLNGYIIMDDNIFVNCDGATIDGENESIVGFYVIGTKEVIIRNCNFKNIRTAIYVNSSEGIHILDNNFVQNENAIIAVKSTKGLIENNQIKDTVGMGITMLNCSGFEVRQNVLLNNSNSGIYLNNSENNLFEANIIIGNVYGSFLSYSKSNNFDSSNFFSGNRYSAFSFKSSGNNYADKPAEDGMNDYDKPQKENCRYSDANDFLSSCVIQEMNRTISNTTESKAFVQKLATPEANYSFVPFVVTYSGSQMPDQNAGKLIHDDKNLMKTKKAVSVTKVVNEEVESDKVTTIVRITIKAMQTAEDVDIYESIPGCLKGKVSFSPAPKVTESDDGKLLLWHFDRIDKDTVVSYTIEQKMDVPNTIFRVDDQKAFLMQLRNCSNAPETAVVAHKIGSFAGLAYFLIAPALILLFLLWRKLKTR